MTASVRPMPALLGLPVVTGATAGACVVALAGLGAAGHGGFATEPAGTLALAVAAVAAAVAASRLARSGHRAAGRLAAGLAASLLAYLGFAVLAVATVAAGHRWAGPAVAAWNSAWIPPLALLQLTASAAVRTGTVTPKAHRYVGLVLGAATLVNALLTTATEPFDGLPTIAGESWRTAFAPVGAAVTLLGVAALLLLPVTLWRAALGSHHTVRARLGVAAAATTAAPLTVVFCLLLAIARAPGDVEPSLGSVAFLVALSGTAVFAVACAVTAARGATEPRRVGTVVRATGLAAAALLVVGVGTLAAAPGSSLGPTSVALVVSALTVVVGGGAWAGTGRLAALLTAAPAVSVAAPVTPRGGAEGTSVGDAPPDASGAAVHAPASAGAGVPAPASAGAVPASVGPVPASVGGLTAREREVLAALAEGASNAGIAAQLVVSERTVDAHLRAIFVKLDLTPGGDTNRRVRAARIWLEHARQRR
ncbi:helix-turn-helix transcriptional regulator [Micromonospora tulbaghiae]|uniref:Regulatory protein, luxR family n=1 Tax=Micromonospora tulbaghiae TaxID=479978 RepID=A0ABY0KLC8_9ACTN|nr:LuxR C-terminal-related transcriptional regulator [Micromonospora tulbaghiae]MDX5461356.1 LuxR C-terminal-related transcriptional regulator [Micromonospora tulbaghiae]SCE85760.1 regulatory protein, luxR family [Micromonospora tulbaghiae]